MRTALNACLLVLLFVFTGCGSFASRWNGERSAYVGVRHDANCMTHSPLGEEMLPLVALADIPLSAVVDTLFLPYDLTGGEQEVRSQPPPSEPPVGPGNPARVGYPR